MRRSSKATLRSNATRPLVAHYTTEHQDFGGLIVPPVAVF
jgi:hypothetical protein